MYFVDLNQKGNLQARDCVQMKEKVKKIYSYLARRKFAEEWYELPANQQQSSSTQQNGVPNAPSRSD